MGKPIHASFPLGPKAQVSKFSVFWYTIPRKIPDLEIFKFQEFSISILKKISEFEILIIEFLVIKMQNRFRTLAEEAALV